MSKVSVASPTKSTSQPSSLAWRVVVSQHCSVRMPATIRRRMPVSTSHCPSGVPTSALWRCFSIVSAAEIRERTETVLVNRFAELATVEEALARAF